MTLLASPLEALATAIKAGDLSGLPATSQPYFTSEDWQSAADYALDSEDYSELEWMVAQERGFQQFLKWQNEGQYHGRREAERRGFFDFDDFMEGKR